MIASSFINEEKNHTHHLLRVDCLLRDAVEDLILVDLIHNIIVIFSILCEDEASLLYIICKTCSEKKKKKYQQIFF